jgi:hypothetical protein
MLRVTCWLLVLSSVCQGLAGEKVIDFGKFALDQSPPGFSSVLSGGGKPGEWRVILDRSAAAPDAGADSSALPVLAQLSQDGTDERFPILIFDEENFGDFTLATRFKIVDGLFEQMAGVAFRIQDTNNYYYVRASVLGNSFRFIKVVNGQRLTTVGPSLQIERGVWHELSIECKGNRISCLLNGKPVIPPLTDNTFTSGKIGFWTKSDSVSYFGLTRIDYTHYEILAQALVRETLTRYPRLRGVRIYALDGDETPKIVASNYPDELGQPGGKVERDVITRDVSYYGKDKGIALVTLPLHDRNGDVAAAVRIVMQSFPGQTEQNALARAQPVVKAMQSRVRNAKDLLQ